MVVTAPARELLDQVLAEVVRETGAHVGAVFLLMPEGRALGMEVITGAPRELSMPWSRLPMERSTPVADAVREGRTIRVGSREELADRYPRTALVMPYDLSMVAAPLTDADTGAVLGTLVLIWSRPRPAEAPRAESALLEQARERLSDQLVRAGAGGEPIVPGPEPRVLRTARAVPMHPDEALAAADWARRLPEGACALDFDGRITYVSPRAAELVGVPAERLVGSLPWESLRWLRDPAHEDRYRAAVLSGQPVSFTALRPPDHWLLVQLYPDATGVSVRISPTDAEAGPSPQAAPYDEAGVPIRIGAIYHLMHLATALTEAVGVDDVVRLVADLFPAAIGADAFVLCVAEGGRLRVIGDRGYRPEVMAALDGTALTARLPAARALNTGVPSFYGSPEDLVRAYQGMELLSDMAAWAFLPLIASGRPVGACVLAFARERSFPADERAALTSLTGLIAQALDRARIYDAKHHLAHSLQSGLLPHTLPALPGLEVAARYLPATTGMEVGGDFYDLIRLDDTCVAAVIGDVQGHNVNAAALMGQVRTAVHAHATAGATPDQVLSRTNRLLDELDTGLFTSCLYVHLQLTEGVLRMASAGHPPALLRFPDGRTDILGRPTGLLLGIDPGAEYPTSTMTLPRGAVLALYTDGLIETPGGDLDEAIAALAVTLSSRGRLPLDELAEALVHYDGRAAGRTDDTALLLLRPVPPS
ncbi:SpoIIE family protein phosphatase [Actinacidiphila glaucinigra]|uniref:SpoIIE family protein phosphatase n=1 Tax=Actinacidiphila glaucinigra TaxID=235986 RepID=UPI003870A650